MGYLRSLGTAKDFVGRAFRRAVVNFAIELLAFCAFVFAGHFRFHRFCEWCGWLRVHPLSLIHGTLGVRFSGRATVAIAARMMDQTTVVESFVQPFALVLGSVDVGVGMSGVTVHNGVLSEIVLDVLGLALLAAGGKVMHLLMRHVQHPFVACVELIRVMLCDRNRFLLRA